MRISNRRSEAMSKKDRQHNVPKKKDKRRNNDL
jgi:hypothetical protein